MSDHANVRHEHTHADAADHAYYAATRAWDSDVIRSTIVSRNRAYVFATLSFVVAVAAVSAVAALVPLKRVEMVVLAYNEQTGVLRKVSLTDDAAKITSDEAYIKNQIHNFVVARETWDMADQSSRAALVRQMLAPGLADDYSEIYNRMNPNAEVNVLNAKIRRTVRIRSISFLNKHTAHVLFMTTDRRAGGEGDQNREWAAVVSFRFGKPAVFEDDLFVNPFGFEVTGYRQDSVKSN